MSEYIVNGSCDSSKCGAACCYVRVFDKTGKFVLEPCEFLDTNKLKCKIYETRPNGCKMYPTVDNLNSHIYVGCGYFIDQQ